MCNKHILWDAIAVEITLLQMQKKGIFKKAAFNENQGFHLLAVSKKKSEIHF